MLSLRRQSNRSSLYSGDKVHHSAVWHTMYKAGTEDGTDKRPKSIEVNWDTWDRASSTSPWLTIARSVAWSHEFIPPRSQSRNRASLSTDEDVSKA